MIDTALLRALEAAGGTTDQVIALVEAAARLEEEKRAAKRAGNAKRQRRFKAKRKVTAGNADNALPSVTPPPNDIYSNPPPISPVEAEASTAPRGRADRGSKISESWEAPPVAELSKEARALAGQWPASSYRAEAEAFLNYWLGESGAKARKADWNRAWANRIVAVHGKVMRQAKFAGDAGSLSNASKGPLNASELQSAIRFWEDHDDPEKAENCRRQLAALRQRGPAAPIGKLVQQIQPGRAA